MKKILGILLLLCCSFTTLKADWQGDKYSLFVHFGLYSHLGGVWNSKPVTEGYSEQIFTFGVGFSDWYEATAKDFNAHRFNADSIVLLAKRSGMRSVVMTAKHHDGFCLFNTETTSYNIVKATPTQRDLLAELSNACHRHGLGFGIYFSLIDWHFPAAVPYTSHNADPITPEHHQYNLQQITELLTRYGRVDELWFDMGSLLPAQSAELYHLVHKLQPQCMVSGRLGNDYADFCVMADNEYPDYTMALPWQTAASMFDETWGYRSWQERGSVQAKIDEKLTSLIRVVAGGGKYLLNIGPMGDGAIVPFEQKVLEGIGVALAPISEAIYNTYPYEGSTYTLPITLSQNTLYLFVPRGSKIITLPLQSNEILNIGTLNGGLVTKVARLTKDELQITIATGDALFTVVRLVCAHRPEAPANYLRAKTLSPLNAQGVYAHSAIDYYAGFKSILGYQWELPYLRHSTLYYTAAEEGLEILLSNGLQKQTFKLEGAKKHTIPVPLDKLSWQSMRVYQRRERFGSELKRNDSALWRSTHEPQLEWQGVVRDRTATYIEYNLHAAAAFDLPLTIDYRDGVMVWFDGIYMAGVIQRSDTTNRLSLVLPLTPGKHTLRYKLYSRWGGFTSIKITPEPYFVQKALVLPSTFETRGPIKLSLTKPMQVPKAAPALLHNLRIRTL